MPAPPPPPPPSSVRLTCTRCGKQFAAALGTAPAQAGCGECGLAAAAATQPPVPPPPPVPAPPPLPPPITSKQVDVKEPAAAPAPKRPLTRAEREAARRKLNMILAIAGAVILALAFVLLSQLG